MGNVTPQFKIDLVYELAQVPFSLRDIARMLGISKDTVSKYLKMEAAPTLCPCGLSIHHKESCDKRRESWHKKPTYIAKIREEWGDKLRQYKNFKYLERKHNLYLEHKEIEMSTNKAFEVGDAVSLKSGSPPMTVIGVAGSIITVAWSKDDDILERDLPTQALVPVAKEEGKVE